MATTIATHLVLESVRTNQIVNHVVDLAGGDEPGDLLAELAEMADDSVDANDGVTEFWGTDENCSEWRVHVRLDGVDACIEAEAKAHAQEGIEQGAVGRWTDIPEENFELVAKRIGRDLTRDERKLYVDSFNEVCDA